MKTWLAAVVPTLQIVVLVLSYLGLAVGSVPGWQMNRATLSFIGAASSIALGTLSLEAAWQAIDPRTIVFLLSLMVVNTYLSCAGFFHLALRYLLAWARSPFGLLVWLTLGTGTLSAFFLNDTLALVSTPLTVQLARSLQLNPIPYLLAIAGATNIGSLATLSGNPQNILVGSFTGIGYGPFAQALAPIAALGLLLQIGWLWLLYPEVRSRQPCPPPTLPRFRPYRPLLRKTLVVAGLLLLAFGLGAPLAESALLAAAALLITRRLKPQRILSQVDWSLLVMFSGLFVLTRCTQEHNLLATVAPHLTQPAVLFTVTAVLSNLISNVPAVLLLQAEIPHTPENGLLLAAGATLAGNLTLFGAVANLITYRRSRDRRRLPLFVLATPAVWLTPQPPYPWPRLQLAPLPRA